MKNGILAEKSAMGKLLPRIPILQFGVSLLWIARLFPSHFPPTVPVWTTHQNWRLEIHLVFVMCELAQILILWIGD